MTTSNLTAMRQDAIAAHFDGHCTPEAPCADVRKFQDVLDGARAGGVSAPGHELAKPRYGNGTGTGHRFAPKGGGITEPQQALIAKLCAELGVPVPQAAANMTKAQASGVIDILIDEAKKARDLARAQSVQAADAKRRAALAARPELEAGMYRKDGLIYKVQKAVHGSGNMYAKLLVVETIVQVEGDEPVTYTRFDYAPGAIAKLLPEHRMTLEEAKEFGALYGTCCVCAATLTDEKSIAAGIGPVCAKRV